MSMRSSDPRIAFCCRLRRARIEAGLSQKQLGIKAGLDEFVASTRINRYEVGVHEPDVGMARRLAKVLNVPLPYLYAEDDVMAEMILAFSRMSQRRQQTVLRELDGKASEL
jgi:transcriptional regulator with XRE-family HTH domain